MRAWRACSLLVSCMFSSALLQESVANGARRGRRATRVQVPDPLERVARLRCSGAPQRSAHRRRRGLRPRRARAPGHPCRTRGDARLGPPVGGVAVAASTPRPQCRRLPAPPCRGRRTRVVWRPRARTQLQPRRVRATAAVRGPAARVGPRTAGGAPGAPRVERGPSPVRTRERRQHPPLPPRRARCYTRRATLRAGRARAREWHRTRRGGHRAAARRARPAEHTRARSRRSRRVPPGAPAARSCDHTAALVATGLRGCVRSHRPRGGRQPRRGARAAGADAHRPAAARALPGDRAHGAHRARAVRGRVRSRPAAHALSHLESRLCRRAALQRAHTRTHHVVGPHRGDGAHTRDVQAAQALAETRRDTRCAPRARVRAPRGRRADRHRARRLLLRARAVRPPAAAVLLVRAAWVTRLAGALGGRGRVAARHARRRRQDRTRRHRQLARSGALLEGRGVAARLADGRARTRPCSRLCERGAAHGRLASAHDCLRPRARRGGEQRRRQRRPHAAGGGGRCVHERSHRRREADGASGTREAPAPRRRCGRRAEDKRDDLAAPLRRPRRRRHRRGRARLVPRHLPRVRRVGAHGRRRAAGVRHRVVPNACTTRRCVARARDPHTVRWRRHRGCGHRDCDNRCSRRCHCGRGSRCSRRGWRHEAGCRRRGRRSGRRCHQGGRRCRSGSSRRRCREGRHQPRDSSRRRGCRRRSTRDGHDHRRRREQPGSRSHRDRRPAPVRHPRAACRRDGGVGAQRVPLAAHQADERRGRASAPRVCECTPRTARCDPSVAVAQLAHHCAPHLAVARTQSPRPGAPHLAVAQSTRQCARRAVQLAVARARRRTGATHARRHQPQHRRSPPASELTKSLTRWRPTAPTGSCSSPPRRALSGAHASPRAGAAAHTRRRRCRLPRHRTHDGARRPRSARSRLATPRCRRPSDLRVHAARRRCARGGALSRCDAAGDIVLGGHVRTHHTVAHCHPPLDTVPATTGAPAGGAAHARGSWCARGPRAHPGKPTPLPRARALCARGQPPLRGACRRRSIDGCDIHKRHGGACRGHACRDHAHAADPSARAAHPRRRARRDGRAPPRGYAVPSRVARGRVRRALVADRGGAGVCHQPSE